MHHLKALKPALVHLQHREHTVLFKWDRFTLVISISLTTFSQ